MDNFLDIIELLIESTSLQEVVQLAFYLHYLLGNTELWSSEHLDYFEVRKVHVVAPSPFYNYPGNPIVLENSVELPGSDSQGLGTLLGVDKNLAIFVKPSHELHPHGIFNIRWFADGVKEANNEEGKDNE